MIKYFNDNINDVIKQIYSLIYIIIKGNLHMLKNKILNNAKWIIACKVVQSLLQLVIGMLCARYLGPSNYGIINYAASIMSFAIPLMQLGLNATLVQELIEAPEQEGKIMGTSLVMDLVSGAGCVMLVGIFVGVANHDEPVTIVVCVLYSIALIFKAFELFQYWFQYKLLSKYPSVVMVFSYIIVSAYRVFLLVTSKSIYWFAVVNALDYAIVGVAMFVIYNRLSKNRLCFAFDVARRLFAKSKYYILSSMMVTIFQNTDHIMLKNISGNAQNGFYTAAVTASIVLQFVYTAIIDSMRPVILECKKSSDEDYKRNISRLYCVTVYLSLAQGVAFTVLARYIIWLLYGAEYLASVSVLRTVVWYLAFSYMGAVRNIWILAEGKYKMLWKINLAGALCNVAINAVLIPLYGALGAAVATLLTQAFTNLVLGFVIKPLRENNRLLIEGLNPKLLLCIFKKN